MKAGYSRDKLIDLLLKGKKRFLSIGLIILTLIIASSIYRNQSKGIESLNVKKDTEIKKNEVLKETSQLETRIKFYKNLLSKKDASLVINTISNIAKDSNVMLISIKPSTEENQPLYIKYPFVLVIGADSYHAIGKFISKIENQSDIYLVEAISIKLQGGSQRQEKESAGVPEPTNKLIVNLTLSIIAFKD